MVQQHDGTPLTNRTLMPRILVVDDDSNLRAAIRRMLEPMGFEIEEAADGRYAMQAFRARPPDLVLCDVFMPEQDGVEVLRDLAKEFASTKVIAMSGGGEFHGPMNLLPLATFLGAIAVLHKPFRQAELLKVFREVFPPLPV